MSSITQTCWPRGCSSRVFRPLSSPEPLLWFKCLCVGFRQLNSTASLMYVKILELMYSQNRWALPDHLTSQFMERILPDGLGWEIQIRNYLIPIRVSELNILPFELRNTPVSFQWLVYWSDKRAGAICLGLCWQAAWLYLARCRWISEIGPAAAKLGFKPSTGYDLLNATLGLSTRGL